MKAIEIESKTDHKGLLKIDYNLHKSDQKVRVLILVDDNNDEEEDEKQWMQSVAKNPAFDFLKDSDEDIYSLNDGEPFDD